VQSQGLVLGFDTSAAHCAAALLSGDHIIAHHADSMARGQGERLMGLLQDLLDGAGHKWCDLTALGVGIGPGNFTGIRISVAAARGLALSLRIPAIGVSSFEATALTRLSPFTASVAGPRDQLYTQVFSTEGAQVPRLVDANEIDREIPHIPCSAPLELVDQITRIAAQRTDTPYPRPAPLYIKAADAAPSRDPAPTLLA
jgi:tRNA threonylcarbamoyladenosine biosynthesis protein TsaB